MRVSLFGLFLRCTSPMEPWPELVRSVLLVIDFIRSYQFYVSLADIWCCPIYSTSRLVTFPYLIIHLCLSLLATWLSPHHSPGEFWLLWILMSRFWSLELVDSPSSDQSGAAEAWIPSRPSRAPSFQAPLFSSRVFLLWLWACLYTVHTCTSTCILAIAHISDVIFVGF